MPEAAHLDFLRAHHADEMGHTSTSLMDHLLGTWTLLVDWGVDDEVAVGGLFHSVYGTESYRASAIPLSLRPALQGVIGARAERLAYLFGAMEKATFGESVFRGTDYAVADRHTGETHAMDGAEFGDLTAMVAANWLEQRPRVQPERQNLKPELFSTLRSLLPTAAAAAVTAAYGFSD